MRSDGIEFNTASMKLQYEIGIDLASISVEQTFASQINKLINPPVPLTDDDIYVRRMRLIGEGKAIRIMWHQEDEFIVVYSIEFHVEDFPLILKLVQGKPLSCQHFRGLPLGAWFGGEIVDYKGKKFVAPNFFWLKGTSQAEDLRINLDGGVYREASVSIGFEKLTCKKCGENLRECEHSSRAYLKKNPNFMPEAWAEDITDIYEGSIVDRGAIAGTGVEPGVRLNAECRVQNAELNTGTDMKAELKLKLSQALGLTGDDATSDDEKIIELAVTRMGELSVQTVTLQGKVDDLTPKANKLNEYVEADRADVLKVALEAAVFQKRMLTDAEKNAISEAKPEGLAGLRATHQAALDAAAPTYECPGCHTKLSQFRRSDPGGDGNGKDPIVRKNRGRTFHITQ